MKKVFLPEYNCFGWEVPIEIEVTNPELFFSLLKDSELKTLMETSIEHERYDVCATIQIDKRTKSITHDKRFNKRCYHKEAG